MAIPTRTKQQQENRAQQEGRGRRSSRPFMAVAAATLMLGALAVVPVAASSATPFHSDNEFRQTNLVSDLGSLGAKVVDPSLKNPWGLALAPTSPLWVADNNADVATLYAGDVGVAPIAKVPLTVKIPGGAPTGQVFNPTTDFVAGAAVPKGPALFIFSSENGDITAWNPSASPAPNRRRPSSNSLARPRSTRAWPSPPP